MTFLPFMTQPNELVFTFLANNKEFYTPKNTRKPKVFKLFLGVTEWEHRPVTS